MSTAAELARDSLAEAVFRRDDGMVHISKGYVKLCQDLKVTPSMGGIGSGGENSPLKLSTGVETTIPELISSTRPETLPP